MATRKNSGGGRVTYATLSAPGEDFHRSYDKAIAAIKEKLGESHPIVIGDRTVRSGDGEFENRSPADTRVLLGRFQKGTREHARQAIAAARKAYPEWRDLGYKKRAQLLRKAADIMIKNKFTIAAVMGYEAGKSRMEAMGDVEESADLIRYYCDRIEEHKGFEKPMGRFSKNEHNTDVLRPYGVWAIISPFNFPMALAAGPAGGALVAGNTVVSKPSSDTPWTGAWLQRVLTEAGLPAGVFNYISGPGRTVGDELVTNPDVDGILFTGSKEVGFDIYRRFSTVYPKPCITEMGGKNPAIVTARADLDKATDGVLRSAFGLSGQKCSACSRVYVERKAKNRFVDMLIEKTAKLVIGDPLQRDVYMGPVINAAAVANYERYIEEARRGGKILTGGDLLKDEAYRNGHFVAPTIVDGLPKDHNLFREEMFLPIVCVAAIDSLDEGLRLANDTEYGLTAGLFSENEREIQNFLDNIEAGVVYVNRRAGATTGAWPGINPFGGWKGSGSSGKASGGPYYVQQFLREQSRTILR
ncbi:MAG: aldehyde dehydrogenase family protein [Acidobacteriota bacterium]